MIHPNKNIEDVDDFNWYASQILDEFVKSFTLKNGLLRHTTEDDGVDPMEYPFILTDRAARLFHRMRDRLIDVGCRHFDKCEVEVESSCIEDY